MKEELKAYVHYRDLIGEIACDGFGGPFLHELWDEAGLPNEYFPVAMSIVIPERFENEEILKSLKIEIYACEKNKYGNNLDEISSKVSEMGGELEVLKFELKQEFIFEILKKIKRLSIIVKNAYLRNDIKIIVK